MRTNINILFAGLVLGMTSCIGGHSPNARFYQLQPSTDLAATGAPLDPSVAIVVNPVKLESYLDHPQMANRVNTYEVHYDEFSRWAEPLDRNITHVVMENLSRALQTENITTASRAFGQGRSVILSLDVKRFERQADTNAVLNAAWSIQVQPGTNVPMIGSAYLMTHILEKTPEQTAAAQARLLAELSTQIASGIAEAVKPSTESK